MRHALSFALMLGSLSLAAGCSFFKNVSVEPVATSFQRPSNVAAYVAVLDGDEPVAQLEAANFHVYENDQLVPADQTQLRLLDRELAVAHHALLLIDMSAVQSSEQRAMMAKAALGFVEKLLPLEDVSVYAFDGAESLVPITSLSKGAALPTSLPALESYTSRDSSRNLNGALVAAVGKLDQALGQSGKPAKVGTLVVFSNGPDVAGRVDADKVHDVVWESTYDVIGIGVAEETETLESVARRGVVKAQAASTLPIAFEEAGSKARAELDKYYLVSYCSPARAGQRRLRLEVTYTTKQGEEHSGDFETDFDAQGFRTGCNPAAVPRLVQIPKESSSSGGGLKTVSETTPSVAEPGKSTGEPSKKKKAAPDSRDHDKGEDAPVAPPDSSGYAK